MWDSNNCDVAVDNPIKQQVLCLMATLCAGESCECNFVQRILCAESRSISFEFQTKVLSRRTRVKV